MTPFPTAAAAAERGAAPAAAAPAATQRRSNSPQPPAPAAVRVATARPDHFPQIARLMRRFDNPRMSDGDWERMLRTHGWSRPEEEPYGFVLLSRAGGAGAPADTEGRVVGFIGTIYCHRRIAGREQRLCTLSCWMVEPDYRGHSLRLLSAALRDRNCTAISFTPIELTRRALERSGFQLLEREVVLLAPWSAPVRRSSHRGGPRPRPLEAITDRAQIAARLTDPEARAVFHDHRDAPAVQMLLSFGRDAHQCLLIASQTRIRRVPVVHVHYLSNPDLFWRELPRVKRALRRAGAGLVMMLDGRHAAGAPALELRLPFGLRKTLPVPRLFRPCAPQDAAALEPAQIDALYSELMYLKQ